jgi:hypothetical protein
MLPIRPDEERQNNWAKVHVISGAFSTRDDPFASAVDVAYRCGNPNINHD